MQQGTNGNQSPRDLNPNQGQVPVTQSTQLQQVLRALAENSAVQGVTVPISITSGSRQVQVLDTVADSQRVLQVSTPGASASGAVQGQTQQVVSPEHISVADYLSQSFAGRAPSVTHSSPPRSSEDTRKTSVSVPATSSGLLALRDSLGYAPISVTPVLGAIAVQAQPCHSQQHIEAVQHVGHGSPGRSSPVRSHPGQRCPSSSSSRSHSPKVESNRGSSAAPLPIPISPSGSMPLPSSPVKINQTTTMSVATNQPPSEVAELRRKTLEEKRNALREVQTSHLEKLTEFFFLQQGHNMMDYVVWKKKPPDPHLTAFLKNKQLEEKFQERTISDESTVKTSGSSTAPVGIQVASSTQLPPEVSAQTAQQKKHPDGTAEDPTSKKGLEASSASEAKKRTSSQAGLDETPDEQHRAIKLSVGGTEATTKAEASPAPSRTVPSITVISATPIQTKKPDAEETAPSVTKISATSSDVKLAAGLHKKSSSIPLAGQIQGKTFMKSTSLSAAIARERQATRQQSLSAVYDYTIGSQEMIVERAKQEAQVMQRIAELRRDGLWSAKRLPRVQEPPRHKAHWDYLLEEMQWLAADFAQERRWKRNAARKIGREVAKYHREQEAREVKAEKEEVAKLRRIAGNIAKEIKAFWANIEKVVQYKQQSRLDERRKKALDIQLDFIVGQTEKYSSWLTEGLNTSTANSSQGSVVSSSSPKSEERLGKDDAEFEPVGDESDDEETIDVEEQQAAKAGEVSGPSEIELLQKESELPIEELLSSLQEAQEKEKEGRRGSSSGDKEAVEQEKEVKEPEPETSLKDVASADSKALESKDDKDFELSADEEETLADDDEETLEEQEGVEGELDHKAELDDLAAEGDLPIEELLKRYQGAYDGDLDDSEEDEESEGSEEEEESSQVSSTEEEEEEEDEAEEDDQDELKDVGMEYLINPDKENEELAEKPAQEKGDGAGPNREITDIAAAAQSIQPTGYTLSDTLVKTKVPFLLRHTLREYQHIGLDWLVTMHDKKLNGILADEMGLGKTIQTIAVLAHLACEDVSWGPHLIVVPTSVMLNWEMEFKKWCPGFKILTYFGSQKERKLKRTGWTKTNAFHVCITSYKLVIQDHQAFRRKKWKYLVLDEAQNIKNFKSQRWQTLLNFSSQRRLLLTGTPLQNNLMELWSLMHFLMPHVFQSHREFKEWFSNPLGGMIEGTQEYNEGIIRRLHKVLRPFLLRRLKSQVEKQLPQKYEHVIRCRLSKRQRFLYDDFMAQTKTKETLSTGHFMSVINVLMQLRKVCNHPDLFESRPIRSPFIMVGLLYYTASLVHRAMEYNPLQHVSLPALNLCIADLEISQSAYVAHRACQLQTPRKLIEEIDSSPEPPQRPPKVKVKPGKLYPSPMALQAQKEARTSPSLVNKPSDRASPSAVHIHGRGSPSVVRVASPINKGRPGSPGLAQVLVRSPGGVGIQARTPQQVGTPQILQTHGRPGTPPVTLTAIGNPRSPGTLTLVSQNPQQVPSGTPLQQLPGFTGTVAGQQVGQRRVVLQQQQVGGVGANGKAQLITTQPITVQLQPGSSGSSQQQGQRLIAGQIRQLPQGGIVQIIQTSGGQQIIRPAVHLTSQSNLVQGGSSSPQVVQRSGGSPQVVLSHTAAQLQAAQQLHQSIQRQLTAQGISPSQAQAVASQLSKVTAQSPLQLQQRQILLQQQQQQQQQQVVINAKTGSVATTQGTQTVTINTSSSSRPSSPSVSIVQVVNAASPSSAKTVNISSPLSTKTVTIGSPSSAKTVTVASPSTKTISVASAAERLLNAASPGLRVTTAASPTLKVTTASSPGPKVTTAASSMTKATIVTQSSTTSTPKVTAKKEESKEAKEAAEKLKKAERKRKASPLYLESLDKVREAERKATLSRIANLNHQRCSAKPVYGQDLFTAVSLFHTSRPAGKRRPFSNGVGIVHCHHTLIGDALRRVEVAFKKTRNLRSLLHTPLERLEELQEITKRYTFVVPTAASPPITMHTSHPPPSVLTRERRFKETLSAELKPKTWCLHPIENLMRMDFPELRLIQYDCGKLQTLDGLLRRLKTEGSRTLIFTQMTKMLDVLERFLNYHGYIYLRLDGTTKVEQRHILMERFNKDSRIFCFILSTRSGGVGVNLTGANAVIFYDSDWNPTMDAQAQDRCHRIGQTRDVHIYRLISEMSIEENILKKSNQKRLLIDVSIEGGNFTTAFFKKNTIKDIFDMSKGTGKLQDMLEISNEADQPKESPPPESVAEAQAPDKPLSQLELEKALARAEDDTDVKAASRAHAEQDAELAEFDESIPYEGEEGKGKDETSRVELELAQLDNQLTPIERYAVVYLEDTLEPITAEQLKEAEEQVEAAKRDWELGRLQALKEQEEREAELEEDEVLYTYSREDAENQVHKGSKSAKRKDRSKGSLDRDDREASASRRNGRDRGRMGSREGSRAGVGSREGSRASGSREGSRTSGSRASSRAGSPPPVIERPTRSRSRASSGASGAEGDTPRQTRSRTTSSGSASDMPLSPRQGDRAGRMAERAQRRTERKEQAKDVERISPRPVGRPRKRPREDTDEKTPRSPERVVPRRRGSASEEPAVSSDTRIMSLRRAKSPDQGAVFSDGEVRATRSGRTLRRSGSVSDDRVGHLEPVEEAKADVDSDATIIEEMDISNGVNHIENPLLEKLAASSELDKTVVKEGDKKTRNLFDLVDLKLKNAENVKDQAQEITAGVAQGSIKSKFEKLDTKNLFANLARRLKKRNVSGSQPLQPVDEDGKLSVDGDSVGNRTPSPSDDVQGDIPKVDVQSDINPALTNAVQLPPAESVNSVEVKCENSSETKDNNDVDVVSVTASLEEKNESTRVISEENCSHEKDTIETDSPSKVSSDSGKRAIDSNSLTSPTQVESNMEASSVECEVVAVVNSMLSSLDDKSEHESQCETRDQNRTDQSKPDVLLPDQVAESLEPSTPQPTALSEESEPCIMPKLTEEKAFDQEPQNEEKPNLVCETSDGSVPAINKDIVNAEVGKVVERVEDPAQSEESPACGGQETSAPESTSNVELETLETLPDAENSSMNRSNDDDNASISMSDVADKARITSLDADDTAGVIIIEGCDIEMVETEHGQEEQMDTSETCVDQGEESAAHPMEVCETIVELGTKRRANMIRDVMIHTSVAAPNESLSQGESKLTSDDLGSQSTSDVVGVTKETGEQIDSVHKNEVSADLQDKTASNIEDAKEVDSISNAVADNSKTIPDNKDERTLSVVVPKLDLSQLNKDETDGEDKVNLEELEPSTNAVESEGAFENEVAQEEQVPDTVALPTEGTSEKKSDLLPSKENSLKTDELSEKKLKQILEKPLPDKPSPPVQKSPVTVPAPIDSSSETTELVDSVADEEESSEDEGSLTMQCPPKPTRSVREIMSLGLPGEKPINLNVDSPSGRTRSRHSSDTVRTRSRAKPTSSPRVTPVRTATKSSPRPTTSSKKPVKPQLASSSSAKRSPRLSASADSSLQTRMRRALRSADPS